MAGIQNLKSRWIITGRWETEKGAKLKVLEVKLNTNRRTLLKKLPYLSSDLNLNYNELASRSFLIIITRTIIKKNYVWGLLGLISSQNKTFLAEMVTWNIFLYSFL